MGVAGSGKSTVGRELAAALGVAFVDADDLHPPGNVAKMAGGTPLEDADRWAWLDAVGRAAAEARRGAGARDGARDGDRVGVVVACSALARSHRDVLRRHGATHLVHLTATPDVLRGRLAARRGHFMGAAMLTSQLAALELPDDEPDVLRVDVATAGPPAAVATILRSLGHKPT
jgi:gluconokinase